MHIYMWVAEDSEEMKGILMVESKSFSRIEEHILLRIFFFMVTNTNINKSLRTICLKALPTGPGFWHFPTSNISAHWNGIAVGLF